MHRRLAFGDRNEQELGRGGKGISDTAGAGRLSRVALPLERSGEFHQLEGKMAGTMIRFPRSSHMPGY